MVVHNPGSCVTARVEDEPAVATADFSEDSESDDDDLDMTYASQYFVPLNVYITTRSIYILDSIHGGHPPSLGKTIQAYLEKKCLSQGTLKFIPNKIRVERAWVYMNVIII